LAQTWAQGTGHGMATIWNILAPSAFAYYSLLMTKVGSLITYLYCTDTAGSTFTSRLTRPDPLPHSPEPPPTTGIPSKRSRGSTRSQTFPKESEPQNVPKAN
jgi:hypothetical protein